LNSHEIPFDYAQGRLSLRLKNGYARDDVTNPYAAQSGRKIKIKNPTLSQRTREGWGLERREDIYSRAAEGLASAPAGPV
jgi:hypothetical protein